MFVVVQELCRFSAVSHHALGRRPGRFNRLQDPSQTYSRPFKGQAPLKAPSNEP